MKYKYLYIVPILLLIIGLISLFLMYIVLSGMTGINQPMGAFLFFLGIIFIISSIATYIFIFIKKRTGD